MNDRIITEVIMMTRERLSIDVEHEERMAIKSYAAAHGQTLKEFVLESIYERMKTANETLDIRQITSKINSTLGELWNNKEDSEYDKL